ncbi:putative undecaprenyl-diphosphatase UppP [Streptococcus cristatus ATCC 51100]|jgi:undecaprenyl-diphosphatase|uniref:Undecaprenyl-diphosphatase n=2 Tax=Streptococcus cristatus TaxID=45634 RepID=A0AAV3EEA9_STRCR|nr:MULTISPECIES: undecaprenyl-diphosphate phosphatase [Streptococcus]EFX52053.1 putative undecaprenyl-diphosphatase UppP [Streptococcus cristatus ATCC 51100]EGU67314.1 undecaprenyl pyrophosphate phosphatase [Streptococcus cristatus ATCC 51100]KJQ60774.1 undecaprenyl pyrophosphate phosphatase [Streptococcus cristatus]MBC6977178.1 undecaprenyl-diphosphate phosphatase [Streptococcus cristatus]RSI43807.1 Undecaprenyl-diphosphatase [Streptococcus cristatus]
MFIIEILKSIIYGIVEGITEWLPISSTGHLILIQDFIKYKNENPAFMEMFNVVIQLGAILAVVVIYFDKLNPFKPGKTARQIQLTWQLWAKVVVAALPAAIIGLFLDDWFEAHFYNLVSVAIMLIIYGAAFIYLEKREQVEPTVTELSRLPYQTALYIGLFQVLSLFPGTSRSGATIVGGLLNGVSRPVVTEFTFYLGIPIMFGASGLKILKFIIKGNSLGFDQLFLLLVAMGVAFGVSLYVIRFLTDYVKNHDFTIFGKYRIGLGVLLLVYGLIKVIIG